MRTFIAIDLSADNKQELARLQLELKKTGADIKWVELENIHLTLKFLGEIADEYISRVKEALDKAASVFKPFEISLSGIGAFPKLDAPRVIWAGVEKGREETEEIAKKIEEELEKFGFAKEKRPFAAHLTIGRVRSRKNIEALKEVCGLAGKRVSGLEPAYPRAHALVNSIVLYQSKLSPKGPTYTPLHKSRLLQTKIYGRGQQA